MNIQPPKRIASPADCAGPGLMEGMTDADREILAVAQPFTMTSPERMAALINAVHYVAGNGIAGDIAECGVWRGGSMMTVALTLLALGAASRDLWLFDTFDGMTAPTPEDMTFDGVPADKQLALAPAGTGIWCRAGLEEVRANLLSTGYPEEKIHFIAGKVEDTIPLHLPPRLAILRLDTDWYESTRHELEHLYPLLDDRGVLIVDDYGHWQGARKAVDEYFAALGGGVRLLPIDYTGHILVKNSAFSIQNS